MTRYILSNGNELLLQINQVTITSCFLGKRTVTIFLDIVANLDYRYPFSNNINFIKFYSLQIIYGGLPDENKREEEEILGRRTRGRKINYREEMASDSEEVCDF